MTRFLCMGDTHIGSGAVYGRDPGTDRLKDHAATLAVIAQTAIEHDVNAILNAGDTFEGPEITPAQEQVFADFVATCREAGIPVITILGNGRHDLAKKPANALTIFKHIDGVEIYTEPSIHVVGDTAVCMLPWVAVDRLVALQDGGDRENIHRDAAELLIRTAREMHDGITMHTDIAPIRHQVLMLHWSIEGAALPNGLPIDEHAHEPILPIDELEQLGFDAIVAGHIHKPQLLTGGVTTPSSVDGRMFSGLFTKDNPAAFYTGSPMPLNFGEGHFAHGVWLLETGSLLGTHLDFLPIESRPFKTLDVDFGDGEDFSMLTEGYVPFVEQFADAVVRVRYTATEEQARRVDHSVITRALYDAGAHKVYAIQADVLKENRARVDGVDEDISPLAAVDAWATANEISTEQTAALVELTARYLEAAGS